MHPGLAKACINLTGLLKGNILDPFCGSGGILIEAGLMYFNITGYDIDKKQLERAKNNLNHYKIKYILENKDASNIKTKADAIITDLPYGKGSKGKDLENLYESFLRNAEKITKNIVIIFPNFVDYKPIIKKTNWKIQNKFEIYIHKSMTRIVLKLSL
jgi:tRNA (guanine10-N2)-dimethyltransferase